MVRGPSHMTAHCQETSSGTRTRSRSSTPGVWVPRRGRARHERYSPRNSRQSRTQLALSPVADRRPHRLRRRGLSRAARSRSRRRTPRPERCWRNSRPKAKP
jgi:hypothetical protein